MADTRTEEEKKQAFLALSQAGWDDIEDLPEYALFPAGAYLFECTDAKLDTENDSLSQTFALVEVQELENPNTSAELIPAPGSLLGVKYFGDFGIKKFKQAFVDVGRQLEVSGPTEYIDQIQGCKLILVVGQRKVKNKETQEIKTFNEVTMAAIAP